MLNFSVLRGAVVLGISINFYLITSVRFFVTTVVFCPLGCLHWQICSLANATYLDVMSNVDCRSSLTHLRVQASTY